MLELAVLGLLKEQDLHGYELKKRLVDTLGFSSGVSFGSLYPALTRLESAGAVKVVASGEAGGVAIPMTGSIGGELAVFRARSATGRSGRGGRGKKVYGITERGRSSSKSCWRQRPSPMTTIGCSTSGWRLPATFPPLPGWGCWSAAGSSSWSGWCSSGPG